jgi:two-component system NtrC family sensor kinase
MKLTAKLVLVFVLGIMVLIAINGYLAIQRETQLFEQDATADAERLGSAMESMVAVVWHERGEIHALEMIQKTSAPKYAMRIRWVWFDASVGDPCEPRTPREQLTAVTIEKKMVTFTVPEPSGEEFIHSYWPIQVNPKRQGGLELSKPTTEPCFPYHQIQI